MATATDQTLSAAGRPRRRRSQGLLARIVRHRHDYLYILPALIVMFVVIGYPVYYVIELSFYKTPPSLAMSDKIFVGLENYQRILAARSFHEVTVNTIIWTVASTFFAFVLGFGAALCLDRAFFLRGPMRGILLVPFVISAVAGSFVWRWMYNSDIGVIGAILVQLGNTDRPLNFLDNTQTVLASLIVVNVWREFPFAMIMMLAGLQTVPDELHRAAKMDGASVIQRFWNITLPHLKSVTLITVLLLTVNNLNSFIIPWIMTGGGPAGASDIWITAIYQLAFGRVRFGVASAYSVILFLVMMVLGYYYVRAMTRGDDRRPE